VAVDAQGNVYVADTSNDRVLKLSAGGQLLAQRMGFNSPVGLAVDDQGNLYIADTFNDRVVKLSPTGEQISACAGFDSPFGVALDLQGNIYVADTNNNRVTKLSSSGQPLAQLATSDLDHPSGIAVDTAGNIYVADTGNKRVLKLSASGQALASLGSAGAGADQLLAPTSVTVGTLPLTVATFGTQRVVLGPVDAVTVEADARGWCVFYFPASLPITQLQLSVSKTGYVMKTPTIAVTAGTRTSQVVRLVAA